MKKLMVFPITNTICTYLAGCFINSTFDSSLWAMSDKESMMGYLATTNIIYLFVIMNVIIGLKDEAKDEKETTEKE